MHPTASWRRATVAALGSVAVALVGLQASAAPAAAPAAVVTVGDQRCPDGHGGAASAARGAVGHHRALDHDDVSPAEQARVERRTDRIVSAQRQLRPAKRVVVPVRVHVMRASDGVTGDVTSDQVAAQVDVLNRAFRGGEADAAVATGFRFVLKGTDYHDDDAWHADFQSVKYRTETRLGSARTLNIWLGGYSDYLGVATFPWRVEDDGAVDGVRVDYRTVPGVDAGGDDFAAYDLGETATHEVGHWLGLYHTFQGGCGAPGDEVADTPAHAHENYDCLRGNSCARKPGRDPIHNYMNYTPDACMNQFTAGQKQRMRTMWRAYRA